MNEYLKLLLRLAKENGIHKPYIVGGFARNLYLHYDTKNIDIDITTHHCDVLRLAILFANEINALFQIFDDSHCSVFAEDTTFDFSSNFISTHSKQKDDALKELESRDFNCNTLCIDIDTWSFVDFLDKAMSDLDNKIIDTVMSPDETFSDDPRRIIRAISIAAKHDFEISERIYNYVNENQYLVDTLSDKYLTDNISKAMMYNKQNAINSINKLGLFNKIPLRGSYKNYIIQEKLLLDYLNGK